MFFSPRHAASVLSIVAAFAIAGCQGGSGASGTGALPSTTSPDAAVGVAPPKTLLRSSVQGIRTFVRLPLRNAAELEQLVAAQSTRGSAMYHRYLTVGQFREKFGPTQANLKTASAALRSEGFSTAVVSQGVVADAPIDTVQRVFKIHLSPSAAVGGMRTLSSLKADRAPTVPQELANVHAQVMAFSPVPMMLQPLHAMVSNAVVNPNNRYGATQPFYWFDDLKQAYSYPSYTSANGSGRTIAIVAAGDFLDSDVAAYFGHEGLTAPNIARRPVDGGAPPFNAASGLSAEVSLDVEQAAGSAPGANVLAYEAPDASFFPSFYDIYTAIDEDDAADVVSTSFGLCELYFTAAYNGGQDYTPYYLGYFHDLFLQGNAEGITFVEGSGDNGSQGGSCTNPSGTMAANGVSAWVDDPNVTGVGGTNLVTSSKPGSTQSTYIRESAYANKYLPGQGFAPGAIYGSGGGVSVYYGKPSFQNLVNTHASNRAVPDVAMMMGGCPVGAANPCGTKNPNASSFILAFNGGFYLVIGTSASAPEFAGLQAIQDQVAGARAGNVNNLIYELAAQGSVGNGPVFHNDIPGNNGYESTPGYNFVVGNGTPYGSQYALLPFGPFAGNPQSASNP